MDPTPSWKTWAEEAGFNRVTEQRFRLPVGSWPKDPRLQEVSAFSSVNFFEGMEAFTAVLFRAILGWSREEVEILNSSVRVASRRKDIHAMFDFVVVTSQKPS